MASPESSNRSDRKPQKKRRKRPKLDFLFDNNDRTVAHNVQYVYDQYARNVYDQYARNVFDQNARNVFDQNDRNALDRNAQNAVNLNVRNAVDQNVRTTSQKSVRIDQHPNGQTNFKIEYRAGLYDHYLDGHQQVKYYVVFNYIPPYTLAGFDIMTHDSNLLEGRRRQFH
jgi:hypothetical protein